MLFVSVAMLPASESSVASVSSRLVLRARMDAVSRWMAAVSASFVDIVSGKEAGAGQNSKGRKKVVTDVVGERLASGFVFVSGSFSIFAMKFFYFPFLQSMNQLSQTRRDAWREGGNGKRERRRRVRYRNYIHTYE